MPALASLSSQILILLTCLLLLLTFITIYILRRPGLSPSHYSLTTFSHTFRQNLKLASPSAPPTPPPPPLRLHTLSISLHDPERTTNYNPFDTSPTTTSSSSPSISLIHPPFIDNNPQRSGTYHAYTETETAAPITTDATWQELSKWTWRFGSSPPASPSSAFRTKKRSRNRHGNRNRHGRYEEGEEEERRNMSESPAQSPLGLSRYFNEDGVGIRDM